MEVIILDWDVVRKDGAKKEFVDRYDIQELLRANHLTDELIVEDIRKIIG